MVLCRDKPQQMLAGKNSKSEMRATSEINLRQILCLITPLERAASVT